MTQCLLLQIKMRALCVRFPGLSNPKALHRMTFQGLSQSHRETLRALAVFQLSLKGKQKKECGFACLLRSCTQWKRENRESSTG